VKFEEPFEYDPTHFDLRFEDNPNPFKATEFGQLDMGKKK
jgi:hypothetical protein